ncbi:HlyD family secretion protein [Neisseria chenwenguii]|uniref:Acriflavin resistance protein n=1 Tax=Neisseria chenwenguii TaxID=1853278 RepID=A0A220RZH1_9NEIS|nr:HlyD family efflux transporter periplasmic adaptor subunit [Neisseria chenwenguii]ASK26630.1 acriflavin resistance protein [Neisseria chenwenguii]ROV55357.1 HlyD family efflux transporter periplasmic adaptor subunit [Neisseria chenwenguii]
MNKLVPLALAAAVAAGGYYIYTRQHTDALPAGIAQSNGRLELNRFDIASLYPGRVEEMLVDEGSEVAAGDVLAKLSSDTSSSRVEAAKAQKQRAVESATRAAAEMKALAQRQKVAQMEWDNALELKRDDLVSDSEVRRRKAERDSAAAQVEAARAAQAEAQAAVNAAQAQINEAASADGDMTIRSPKAGRVEYKIAETGSVIAAGSKVVSLLDPADVSMNIFLPNGQAGRLKTGDDARIRLDSLNAVFPAKISFIATDAQFTPKAVETADERAKLMFKVKLKIPADTALKYNRLLKGGMTGNGFVKTDAKAAWPADLAVKLPK